MGTLAGSIRLSGACQPYLRRKLPNTTTARTTSIIVCTSSLHCSGNKNNDRSSSARSAAPSPLPSPPAPAGRVTSLPTVWNTVSRRLESLPDPSTGPLKWYSCGPTVYDSAHLGHARTYVCLDVVRRILTDYFRFDVTYALGVTDIDDKIIARARERGLKDWPEIAAMALEFEKQFMDDMSELGVRAPDAITRVTDHLPDIVAYIEGILENGMAYEAEGGVYFDVESMGSGYGKLGVQASTSTTPDEGADLRGKKSHKDFALWKRAKPDEPWWESPFGRGRPGWHIECSAMTHSLFGPGLDIHSGGVDLKFPHHTNEIAQCEAHACGGAPVSDGPGGGGGGGRGGEAWVRHWLHTGHLNIEGLKMSKSLKNFVTVREYLKGHPAGREAAAEDFRMFCLMHKYSSTVTFSEDRMEEASVVRRRFQRLLALVDATIAAEKDRSKRATRRWGDKEKRLVEETSTCRREVRLALCDDFDTPRAVRQLTALCTLVSNHVNDLKGVDLAPVVSAANYVAETLTLLGVGSSTADARLRVGEGRVGLGAAEPASAAEALPPTREVIAAMVEFRRLVREIVLERNLSKNPANGKLMKRNLLQLADRTRDETLPSLGIHVHDEPDNQCTWMMLPPDARRARRKIDPGENSA